MRWKVATALFAGFSAGMVFTLACATGSIQLGAPGIGTAHAGTESATCSKWEVQNELVDHESDYSTNPTELEPGWEPFGVYGGSVTQLGIWERRCAD